MRAVDREREAGRCRRGRRRGIAAGSCSTVVAKIAENLDDDEKSTLRDAKVERVVVNGETATAAIAGAPASPRLTKSDGHWLVSGGLFSDATAGGLSELFQGGGGDQLLRHRIHTAEQRLADDPQDRSALVQVIRGRYQLASASTDPGGRFDSAAAAKAVHIP